MLQSAFMMYMSGSHITIWSMMMTSMGIINPIQSIFQVNKVFKRFEDPPQRTGAPQDKTDLTTPKLLYIALNLASLGVALWKCKAMGLLPVTSADWTSYLIDKVPEDYGAMPL
jgi:hypothetical protein